MPNYGVIDLGSNSIRMVIYDVPCDRQRNYTSRDFRSLINDKVMAGLAAFVKDGAFTEQGIARATNVLRGHAKRAKYFKCKRLDVFATAVLRNATNCDEVVNAIQEESGLTINLLSARDESHLGFVGAKSSNYIEEGTLIDIGGGSTELTRIHKGKDSENRSLPIGSLSTFSRFVEGVVPTPSEMDAITQAARDELATLPDVHVYQSEKLYGVGGSVRASGKMLAQLALSDSNVGYNDKSKPKLVTSEQIHGILKLCKESPNHYAHEALKASAERVHTLTPGCVILQELFYELGAQSLEICKCGVREGYLIERMLR